MRTDIYFRLDSYSFLCLSHSILEKCISVQIVDTWRIFFFFLTLGKDFVPKGEFSSY